MSEVIPRLYFLTFHHAFERSIFAFFLLLEAKILSNQDYAIKFEKMVKWVGAGIIFNVSEIFE
jgi:hypothetical protein